jgi:hypothetical protein
MKHSAVAVISLRCRLLLLKKQIAKQEQQHPYWSAVNAPLA